MRILLLGSGSREHALAKKMKSDGHEMFCFPGNLGTDAICGKLPILESPPTVDDFDSIIQLIKRLDIALTVVQCPYFIASGIVDYLEDHGCMVAGASQEAARLDTDRAYSKKFIEKHRIPTARWQICPDYLSAIKAVQSFIRLDGSVVLKTSRCDMREQVKICTTVEQAEEYLKRILCCEEDYVIIEEKLEGAELCMQMFCDGLRLILMPSAQTYKHIFNGDQGEITSGMGAVAPSPLVTFSTAVQIHDAIIDPISHAIITEELDYRGILTINLILTEEGPKIIDFTCGMGDPEAQAVLPLLESDLSATLVACAEGNLENAMPFWNAECTCSIVLRVKTEDGELPEDRSISNYMSRNEAYCFLCDVDIDEEDNPVIYGDNVLTVTAQGYHLIQARQKAYELAQYPVFQGRYYRTDIGQKALEACRPMMASMMR